MHCPNCKKSTLVEITLKIAAQPVTMRSCSACGSRWWQTDGKPLHLPGVLALAAKR